MTHLMENGEIVGGPPPADRGTRAPGLAVAALTATLMALAPSAIAGDHGDTPETATLLGYGSGVPGTLETRDDVDVFRLDLQGRAELLITSHGDTDARGRLLDAAGDQIAEDDDSGTDFNFLMRETVDGGVYYVEVSSAFDAGSYVLLARIRKPGDDHGDTPGASTPLPLNVRVAGSLTQDDVDVFRIDVPVATDLRAYTLGSTNTRGVLSDSGGNRIRTASSGGDGGNFRIESPVQAGIYYLEVAADGTGSYGVRADVDDDGSCPAPPDPGDGGTRPPPQPTAPDAPTLKFVDARTLQISWSFGPVTEGERYAFDDQIRFRGDVQWEPDCNVSREMPRDGEQVTLTLTYTFRNDLPAGETVQGRYRYRNSDSCETGQPGLWSRIGEARVPAAAAVSALRQNGADGTAPTDSLAAFPPKAEKRLIDLR